MSHKDDHEQDERGAEYTPEQIEAVAAGFEAAETDMRDDERQVISGVTCGKLARAMRQQAARIAELEAQVEAADKMEAALETMMKVLDETEWAVGTVTNNNIAMGTATAALSAYRKAKGGGE